MLRDRHGWDGNDWGIKTLFATDIKDIQYIYLADGQWYRVWEMSITPINSMAQSLGGYLKDGEHVFKDDINLDSLVFWARCSRVATDRKLIEPEIESAPGAPYLTGLVSQILLAEGKE